MAECNILIVSSQEFMLDQLQLLIKRSGFRVIKSSDGYSALRIARSQCPIVTLIDQEIKGLDSFQLGEIFELDELSPIVYILDQRRKLQFGKNYPLNVFGFIEKPINPNQFYTTLENVILSIEKIEKMNKKIKWLERKCLTQKIIGQAKFYLIQKNNWNEDQAYEYIKKRSMDKCVKLEMIAKQILEEKDV